MKLEAEVKQHLINNAIRLISKGGFEAATTKELAFSGGELPGIKMNEVYIYRLFGGKENLYEQAFIYLDENLFNVFREAYQKVGGVDTREKFYEFFLLAWNFILENEKNCRCYIRYYYSIYFKGNSLANHRKLINGVVESMKPLFKEEAEVAAILHSVFVSFLDFGIRVHNGELENDDENRTHIFNVLYCMMSTYFKS